MSLPGKKRSKPVDAMESMGMVLLRRRLELGLTQEEVAQRAAIAKSYVSQIENATRPHPPSSEVLARLERALALDMGVLVRRAQWESAPPTVKRRVQELDSAAQIVAARLRGMGGMLSPTSDSAARSDEANVDAAKSSLRRLDALYRSGELARLVSLLEGDAIAPPPGSSRDGSREEEVWRALPVEVPLINSVAAGYPRDFTDLGYPARVADAYVRSPDVHDPDAFAARVVGDSMEPEYREGDIVVFSPAKRIVSGMDCFVRLEPDHESTFKRIFFEIEKRGETSDESSPTKAAAWDEQIELSSQRREFTQKNRKVMREARARSDEELSGAKIRLTPLNNKYPVRVVAREHVAGMYAAVSVTRTLG